MAGKFVPLVISGILLFSISASLCLADVDSTSSPLEDAEINKQKDNICSLIEKGKFSEAKAATEKMIIEFPGQAKLPDMLYWIAGRFQTFDRFEDAKQIQEQIIRDFPDSPWAKKARMGSAMTEAISLVVSGRYAEAKVVTDKMAVDFAGNPDLAEMLYWIAERFQRVDRFDEAKQIYQRIIDDFLTASFAKRAKLSISRAQVESLIVSQQYDDANAALAQFIADFSKSPDLPEALFWLTERYERLVRLEEARQNYQRIIDQFPNNLFSKRAKLGISRAEVIALVEAGDFNDAAFALNKMTSDFAGHSDMPWSLYLVAQRYESKGKQDDANGVCQQIIQNYPDSLYASKVATEKKGLLATENTEDTENKTINVETEQKAVEIYRIARGYEDVNDFDSAAKAYQQVVKDYPATIKGGNAVLDIRRLEILKAFDSGEANQADILLAQYVEDFNQNSYAGDCLELLVDKCYWTAFELMRQNKQKQANSRFAFAENILQIMLDKKTTGNSAIGTSHNFAALYFYAAGCRQHQQKWDGAIKYFQKIVDNYPDYKNICNAQAAVGWCYEALARSENWPKEASLPLIEEAYKAVLDNYPNGNMAYYAAYRLGELSVEKGDKKNALTYYRKFLEVANQDDPRIETVKAKLASLEENK